LARRLKEHAQALGFSMLGVVPARPSPHLDAYLRWIQAGMHGGMAYLARPDRIARRADLSLILPDARSLIVVALDYFTLKTPDAITQDPARGRISSYAWGTDYHTVMLPRLEALADFLQEQSGAAIQSRAYVDTGAILERSHAQQAGLGFIGKNTMLISPQRGSLLFLGEIITDLELEYDPPARLPSCGTCARCLTACPTRAFPAPYVLDARRCISYLTIEHQGFIPAALRPLMGNWVYGCDVCQEVCPWQRFSQPSSLVEDLAPPDPERVAPPLSTLLTLDDAGFDARFQGTAIHRIRRDRLVRNACVAAGNSNLPEMADYLLPLLEDRSEAVRGHAAWALGRIGGSSGALELALEWEEDHLVRAEIIAALE